MQCWHPFRWSCHEVAQISISEHVFFKYFGGGGFSRRETTFVAACLLYCIPTLYWKRTHLKGKSRPVSKGGQNDSDSVASLESVFIPLKQYMSPIGSCGDSEGSDRTARTRSMIMAFTVRKHNTYRMCQWRAKAPDETMRMRGRNLNVHLAHARRHLFILRGQCHLCTQNNIYKVPDNHLFDLSYF